VQGIQVGSLFEDQKVFDVIVQGTPATRESISNIRNLLIDRPSGGHVRLGDVADVRTVQTPSVIQRDAVSRRMDVVAGVNGRSTAEVAADIRGQLGTLTFPLAYHAEVLQQSTADEIGMSEAIGVAIAGVIAAFLLFQAAFGSWRLALLVTAALPVSLVGGLVAGLIAGPELELGSLLGFLAVLGWTTRVEVVMISRLQSLARESMANDSTAIVMQRGARERLAPIITSALAVGGVCMPFVVLGSRPGLEILHPMAVVLLGGLISAVLVSLFLVPPLYLHFGPRRQPALQLPAGESAQPEPADVSTPTRPAIAATGSGLGSPRVGGLMSPDSRRWPWIGQSLATALIALSGTACTQTSDETGPKYAPATLGSADAAGVKTVTFTDDAAQRVRLQTSPVVAGRRGVAVDYAALIYDKKGQSWVYTVPQPLTFVRRKVTVNRIVDNRAMLSEGPAPGVQVVTTGAAEVYGAELDISGKH
jgi:preprotein translocase subunit SecF